MDKRQLVYLYWVKWLDFPNLVKELGFCKEYIRIEMRKNHIPSKKGFINDFCKWMNDKKIYSIPNSPLSRVDNYLRCYFLNRKYKIQKPSTPVIAICSGTNTGLGCLKDYLSNCDISSCLSINKKSGQYNLTISGLKNFYLLSRRLKLNLWEKVRHLKQGEEFSMRSREAQTAIVSVLEKGRYISIPEILDKLGWLHDQTHYARVFYGLQPFVDQNKVEKRRIKGIIRYTPKVQLDTSVPLL